MTRDTSSSTTTSTFHHYTYPIQEDQNQYQDQDQEKEQTEGEYLEAVKRMHAKQDAWSRASASTPSESGSGSRSPISRAERLHMTTSNSFGSTTAGAGEGSRVVEKKGRKKVAKACLACQKSHVTCDDSELSWLPRP
jgi:hypothetical protein